MLSIVYSSAFGIIKKKAEITPGPHVTADVLQLRTCVALTSRGSCKRGSESELSRAVVYVRHS